MQSYYIGRQPIFDAGQRVIGYELLYRQHRDTVANVIDGDQATSQVIMNSFWEMGLDKVVGAQQAFVNVTRNFIVSDGLLPPPDGQLVLEILEDIVVDNDLVAAVRALKHKGYVIALDDFVYHHDLRPLVELADIVKIDVQGLEAGRIEEHAKILKQFPMKLLAEKVETPEVFDHCRALGFDYFQGYFLCRPRVLHGRRLPANRVNAMRMMAKLQNPEVDVKGLEEIISQDVAMSYKLLRYINSAAFALTKQVDSIRHAIVYLGEKEIRRWASLISLAGIDDKPDELITLSLIRAKMCELLASVQQEGSKDAAFIVGLFSTLDAIMDQPLEELLDALPLAPEITEALMHDTGPYAKLLRSALAYERGDWDQVDRAGANQDDISDSYLRSVDWADATVSTLRAGER